MKKRIISLLILSLITASMIGCGDENSSSSSTSVASTSSSSSSSSTEKEDNKSETGDITEEMVNNHEVTDASKFRYEENTLYPEYGGISITSFEGDDEIVVVPEEIEGKKVVGIGVGAFANNDRLLGIKLPDSIKYIGADAFCVSDELQYITLSNKLEIIGELVFNGATSLKKIKLPDTIKDIGESAFANCKSMKEIVLPESLGVPKEICFLGAGNNGDFTIIGKPGIGLEEYANKQNVKFRSE